MQGEATRAAVIRAYEDWLAEQLLDPSSPASREIHRLAELARKQDLCLVCWCAPKACHADIIKRTFVAQWYADGEPSGQAFPLLNIGELLFFAYFTEAPLIVPDDATCAVLRERGYEVFSAAS
jgi:hypothetical protein